MRELLNASHRFSELRKGMPRISRNLLMQRLAALVTTPAFQEYPAGHPGVSNAAASVLASAYGDCSAFTVTSATEPGVERAFASFSDAVAQVQDARVLGGIHSRFAVTTAARMGADVARYVERTVTRPAG